MNVSTNRSDISKKYKTSIYCPGCPCCGSVKSSRELKIVQRRAKIKQDTKRQLEQALLEMYS